MKQNHLTDPREMYYTDKFKKQEQQTPALQSKMDPIPDCGEKSYKGHGLLKNRHILITGGDSGIGRAVAIACAREGAHIALHFLPGEEKDAQEVKEWIEKAGQKVLLLPGDFKHDDTPKTLIEQTIKEFGALDTLVLNAGQQIAQNDIATLELKQVEDTFKVNILSMFSLVKEALPHLSSGSSIIMTTSIQAFNPSADLLDYAATKAAISNFVVGLAKQLSKKGIRVNGVAPGPIWTPLQLDGGQFLENIPEFGQHTLLKRAGQPAELAFTYVFLASQQASYVTGQVYGITGGAPVHL